MRVATPSIGGITWERLAKEHSITYPCRHIGDPGEPILFQSGFPTANGRAKFVPAHYSQAAELPDAQYPFILITGRQLEHWHTGSMTRNATVLNAIEPRAIVSLHPHDMSEHAIHEGELVTLRSRRGKITARARTDDGLQPGSIFVPFCYVEAAANLLTVEELDPYGKIPEFKFCAVALSATDNE